MKFRHDRKQAPRSREQTPWEKYQSRAVQQRKRAQTPRWYRRTKRIGDKLPRLRQQRHRELARRLALLLSIFLVVIGVMVYLISPLSHVQAVTVKGTQELSAKQVQRAVGIRPGDSIFKVVGHQKRLQRVAPQHSTRLKRVRVQFQAPNRVTVRVHEYATAGYVVRNGQYYEVLENGVVSQQSVSQPKSGTPVYGKFKSTKALHRMILQYARLSTAIKHSISEIQAAPTKMNAQRVHLFMNDGNEVYASIGSFAKKMAYYPSIAHRMKQKGVVHLEVGAYSSAFTK